MKKSFHSSRNIVLSAIINATILLMVYFVYYILKEDKDWYAIPIFILSAGYVAWIWYSPLAYVIEEGKFYYIYGRKKSKIYSIHDITEAVKSKTPIAGAARGIKRIEIMCHGDCIIISPKNRDLFISALKEVNPDIRTK